MTRRKAFRLAVTAFLIQLGWAAYGGLHYGWSAPSPFSWMFVQTIIVMVNAAAFLHLWYRIQLDLKEQDKNDH